MFKNKFSQALNFQYHSLQKTLFVNYFYKATFPGCSPGKISGGILKTIKYFG